MENKKTSKYKNLEAELVEKIAELPESVLTNEFNYVSRIEFRRSKRERRLPNAIKPVDLIRFIEKYL